MSATNQKLKLMRVKEIFERETDAKHGIQMSRILDILAMYGIFAERKSIYADIDTLEYDLGMDISRPSGSDKEYRLLSRKFDISELRLIIDAIQADKFLSEKTCDQLIHKIESLCSKHEAKSLQDGVYVSGRVKSPSDETATNVGWIHEAILGEKQIMFRYFDYDVDKKRRYRTHPNGGNIYVVSPYYLLYDSGKYYLMAYAEYAEDKVRIYRVDKMANLNYLDQGREGHEVMEKIDPAQYIKSVFGMFGGRLQAVTMWFDDSLAGVVMDKFGYDVMMRRDGEKGFIISVEVAVSQQFYGWVFGLGTGARIVCPENVRRDYVESLKMNVCGCR